MFHNLLCMAGIYPHTSNACQHVMYHTSGHSAAPNHFALKPGPHKDRYNFGSMSVAKIQRQLLVCTDTHAAFMGNDVRD